MSVTLIAWNNYVKTAVLTAGSTAPNMSVGALQNDSGSASTGWQTAAGVVISNNGANFAGVPTTLAQTWRALGIFGTNLTNNATVVFQLWNNIAAPVSVVATNVTAVNGQAVLVLPSDTVADYFQIAIYDAGNPDGYINVPLCYAGPAWFPLTGASWNSTFGRDDQTTTVVTRGGQEYPVMVWQKRHYNLALDGVRASEIWTDLDLLEQFARAGGNILFIPSTASATMQNEAIFGRLKPTADVSYPYAMADRRSWKGEITQRL